MGQWRSKLAEKLFEVAPARAVKPGIPGGPEEALSLILPSPAAPLAESHRVVHHPGSGLEPSPDRDNLFETIEE